MIRRIKSIKNIVKKILTEEFDARDNDRLLICKVWAEQDPEIRIKNYSFVHFAKKYIKGEFADTESIRRIRQKLQEQHPELRGHSYWKRHYELEPEMREGITRIIT